MPPIDILSGDPFSWDVHGHRSAVAIGVFDGVHRGHQEVLKHLRTRADEAGGTAIALTFDPHPLELIDPDRAPRTLTTIEDRAGAMAECGVEIMGVLPFLQIRNLDPRLFVVEILVDRLNAAWVAVGGNFRFGRDRAGDPEMLRRLGEERGFGLDVVSMVGKDTNAISSTRIREYLDLGDVRAAAGLLGRKFSVRGPVVHGDARGRAIGFPTANLYVPERMAVPAHGVYAVIATVAGVLHRAVVNIGVRPTFGTNTRTVEAHLVDFDDDIYGEEIVLEFVDRIREERRFDSLDDLKAQIAADTREAVAILEAADAR